MLPESNLARPRTSDDKLKNGRTKAPVNHPQPLRCPRCDSPNTKFCYYNNYSLSQPRHFCKACRRYWTKGGALRSVPVGGGCRKNKKVKSSFRLPSKDSGSSSNLEIGRLGIFNGTISSDFQPGRNSPFAGFFDQFGGFSLDQSRSTNSFVPSGGFNNGLKLDVDTSIASSIESLSSINQDLHWKLQQQRLAMLFGGDAAAVKDGGISISKPEVCNSSDFNAGKDVVAGAGTGTGGDSAAADEWFFGDSYAATSVPNAVTGAAAAAGSYNSGESAAAGCDGVQEWHDLHQYSHLP